MKVSGCSRNKRMKLGKQQEKNNNLCMRLNRNNENMSNDDFILNKNNTYYPDNHKISHGGT